MKWLKRIFMLLEILGVICLGVYIAFNVAYARGETTGYSRGYLEGGGLATIQASKMAIVWVSRKVMTRATAQVKPMAMRMDMIRVRRLAWVMVIP